ncbi:hypothetical protein TUM3792_45490 [Shewanella sp. MBTL60-007]|nr:hypothetical protein TUM3792_45490 [Shewanella sp. MBTL60-007]
MLICVLYTILPKPFSILGEKGVLESISGFLQVLVGFYIAALGAIATFPNKNIDELTDGIPIKLDNEEITRRQFLSYMFGYLAFTSFILVLLSKIIVVIEPSISLWAQNLGVHVVFLCTLVFLFFYFMLFNSLMFTTLFGLYYLTEKIHERKTFFDGELGEADSGETEPEDY